MGAGRIGLAYRHMLDGRAGFGTGVLLLFPR